MPLTRISERRGKSAVCRKVILDSLCQAKHATLDVPDDDRFMMITGHDEDALAITRRMSASRSR